jgi:hypothetical protein
MCCGANRTILSQTRTIAPIPKSVGAARIGAGGQRSNVAYFEYTGKTAMTVLGPVSGLRYRFASPGSRLAVDLRDRTRLTDVPHLVQVASL